MVKFPYMSADTCPQLWQIRPTFADSWNSDIFTKETETLTKALQKSFASDPFYDDDVLSTEMVESLFAAPEVTPVTTPTISGGSENDTPLTKQRRSVAPSGRVTKRKARASKRATTTFITADPSNFRQMVQQVTGVSFGGFNGQLPVSQVLKPEPHRSMTLLQPVGLPTLERSAFSLHHPIGSLISHLPPPASDGVAASTGLDLDSFCGFPTLESWKVM